jgi:Ca2+-binding EF-hand superfamily protein
MKKTLAMSIAFLAFAGAVYDAVGQDRPPMRGGPGMEGGQMPLQRADVDGDGEISFDEFASSMSNGIGGADLNHDGKITTEEIVKNIVETRVRPMAENMVRRFDANGDGALTMKEIDQRQKQMFARLDRNGNGKIEASEMPRRGQGGPGRQRQ